MKCLSFLRIIPRLSRRSLCRNLQQILKVPINNECFFQEDNKIKYKARIYFKLRIYLKKTFSSYIRIYLRTVLWNDTWYVPLPKIRITTFWCCSLQHLLYLLCTTYIYFLFFSRRECYPRSLLARHHHLHSRCPDPCSVKVNFEGNKCLQNGSFNII